MTTRVFVTTNVNSERSEMYDKVKQFIPVEIEVTESNDPRSYRQNSDKLLNTGFPPEFNVENGITDVIEAYKAGRLKDEDHFYNIRAMKNLKI